MSHNQFVPGVEKSQVMEVCPDNQLLDPLGFITYEEKSQINFDFADQSEDIDLSSTATTNNFSDLGSSAFSHNQTIGNNFDVIRGPNGSDKGLIGDYHGKITSRQDERSRTVTVPGARPSELSPDFEVSDSQPISQLESMREECLMHITSFFKNIMTTGSDLNNVNQAEYLLKAIRDATAFSEGSQKDSQGQTYVNLSESLAQASVPSGQIISMELENISNHQAFPNLETSGDYRAMSEEEIRARLQPSNLLGMENSARSNTRQGETRMESLTANQQLSQHYPTVADGDALGPDQYNQNSDQDGQNQEHNYLPMFATDILGNNQVARPQNAQIPKATAQQSKGKNIQVSIVKRVAGGIEQVMDSRQNEKVVLTRCNYIVKQLKVHNLIGEPWEKESQFKKFISDIQTITCNSYKRIKRITDEYPQYKKGFLGCISDFLSEEGQEDFNHYLERTTKLLKKNRDILRNDKQKFSLKLKETLKDKQQEKSKFT